ncbi:sugar transferase [Halorhodospira sp. 9621]|uniref:sugar transferase n=1 Tax=Halorhodospira sp. 9621 TaxID=2899135 RepID=UPI001EE92279|nr:sugar transferase [Halorhodospira sp. 9621]MCG5532994.1 sugar transferase [Halorhodospira sp. 9621]
MSEPGGWRLFESAISAVAIVLLLPLFLVLAAAIRLDSAGPVLYHQRRVGQHGELFWIWKLRTMTADAEHRGPSITRGGDARITRIGRLLRRYKLDELPQLVNVLRGEMSLIGPRPEVPEYVALYTEDQRRVLEDRPGITDPASVAFADEEQRLAEAEDPEQFYREVILPEKLHLYLAYRGRRSWRSDLGLLLRTLGVLAARRGRQGVSRAQRPGG